MAQAQPVISTNFPYLSINVEIRDWQDEALALLDTGFTGEIIVPESVLGQDLGNPDEHTDVELGDNSIVDAPIYLGTLEIMAFPRSPMSL